MYFRIHHFRTHHVTGRSRKPWQHSPRQEARFLLQGHDEHTKKEKPNKNQIILWKGNIFLNSLLYLVPFCWPGVAFHKLHLLQSSLCVGA